MTNEPWTVELLFANGESRTAHVSEDDLAAGGFEDSVEGLEEYASQKVTNPATPHWTAIGDVHFFTQSLSCWRVL